MTNIAIWSKDDCPYCAKAKEQLASMNLPFEVHDVNGEAQIEWPEIKQNFKVITVPQIFVGNYHVGGYTDMMKLISMGVFDDIVKENT